MYAQQAVSKQKLQESRFELESQLQAVASQLEMLRRQRAQHDRDTRRREQRRENNLEHEEGQAASFDIRVNEDVPHN